MAVKKIGEGTPFEPPIPQNQVQNLEADLGNKANVTHNHNQSDVSGLLTALAGKASTTHNHNLADLAEKSYNSLTDKPNLTLKANVSDLASVATSGDYNDLSNLPEISAAASVYENVHHFNPAVVSLVPFVQTTELLPAGAYIFEAQIFYDTNGITEEHGYQGQLRIIASDDVTYIKVRGSIVSGDNSSMSSRAQNVDTDISALYTSASYINGVRYAGMVGHAKGYFVAQSDFKFALRIGLNNSTNYLRAGSYVSYTKVG